jgi:hypothetical protein
VQGAFHFASYSSNSCSAFSKEGLEGYFHQSSSPPSIHLGALPFSREQIPEQQCREFTNGASFLMHDASSLRSHLGNQQQPVHFDFSVVTRTSQRMYSQRELSPVTRASTYRVNLARSQGLSWGGTNKMLERKFALTTTINQHNTTTTHEQHPDMMFCGLVVTTVGKDATLPLCCLLGRDK